MLGREFYSMETPEGGAFWREVAQRLTGVISAVGRRGPAAKGRVFLYIRLFEGMSGTGGICKEDP